MLKDITIGQYFPGKSAVHKMDPRFKIVIAALMMVMLFVADGYSGLGVGGAFILIAFIVSRINIVTIYKNVKPMIPFLLITALFNFFFIEGGEEIYRWRFISVTDKALSFTGYMLLRIVFLIISSSIVTYTTSPIVLTDAIEHMLSPLKKFKLPVHEFALMMTIALRFIPTLLQETEKIMSAQKARGADFESGSLVKRAKALIPIIIPLFVSAFMRANELATAMTCRCYRGGDGRTRLKQLKSAPRDYVALILTFAVLAVVLVMNRLTTT